MNELLLLKEMICESERMRDGQDPEVQRLSAHVSTYGYMNPVSKVIVRDRLK
jgi:hypothetical protein